MLECPVAGSDYGQVWGSSRESISSSDNCNCIPYISGIAHLHHCTGTLPPGTNTNKRVWEKSAIQNISSYG